MQKTALVGAASVALMVATWMAVVGTILAGKMRSDPIERPSASKTDLIVGKARSAYRDGRYQEASNLFSHAIVQDPANGSHFRDRAVAKLALNDEKGAVEDLTEAILREPSNGVLYQYRGFVRLRMNAWKAAVEDLSVAADLNPSATVFYNRAVALNELGQRGAAQTDYKKALELAPPGWNAGKYAESAILEISDP